MSNSRNRIFIYGIDEENRIVRYTNVTNDGLTIRDLSFQALSMKHNYPNIRKVYAVDNSYDIYEAFCDSIKRNSVENRTVFAIMLENYGLLIG
ncbi:MAG: hypothetical protein RR475_02420 [Clostridia bacterium]